MSKIESEDNMEFNEEKFEEKLKELLAVAKKRKGIIE